MGIKHVASFIVAVFMMVCITGVGMVRAEEGIVNLNKAGVEELMSIDMIDIPEELAQAIVDYRKANGPFKTPEELSKVPGMTLDYLEELNPQLTDDGDVVYDPDAMPALAPSKC